MATKRKQITFDEQGMRSFKNVNDAIDHFIQHGLDEVSIMRLFNQTFQLNVGVVSVNLSTIDKTTDLKSIFGTDDHVERFHELFAEWKNKFNVKSIENVEKTENDPND
jgi:hypothetical protein